MFIRIKKSKNSPKCGVQIVESKRVDGKVRQRIVKHLGTAMEGEELEALKALAESIKLRMEQAGQLPLFADEAKIEIKKDSKISKDDEVKREDFNVNLLDIKEERRVIKGIHDVYGKLYDELGFNGLIGNPARNKRSIEALKEIVLARVANPDSKRGSVNNLETNFAVHLDLNLVYRMMDKISDKEILKLNKLVYTKTKSLFKEKIDVIYFDATTLYFESFTEDEFKKNGYSKDGKFNQPQVVLALMVTKEGLPVGYKAFSGDTFDGHTLIPVLKEIKEHYDLDKVVYVADAGMFNRDNLKEFETLDKEKMTYIVGARIKNMPKSIQEQILDSNNYKTIDDNTKVATFEYEGKKLLVSHSLKRAKKDKYEREKGIEKLRIKLSKEKSVKSHLSNQGYKKYLQLEESFSNQADDKSNNSKQCDLNIVLNEKKIEEDAQWDGLKGIITNNSELTNKELLQQYSNLWQVEESFRITKHDLKIRPIYHHKEERVKAHLAISFMAYTLVRHLEHRVRLQYKKLSPQRIRTTLLGVQESILYDTKHDRKFALPSAISLDAEKIYKLMEVKINKTPYKL
jgi:transposase